MTPHTHEGMEEELREEFNDWLIENPVCSQRDMSDWWLNKISLAVKEREKEIREGVEKIERKGFSMPNQRNVWEVIDEATESFREQVLSLIESK
jgi:hypothetical protein